MRYCDEVWTGIEYHVGAHCIMEGMLEEGLKVLNALRARYDGTRRNPYNEIECGDHYARAMAGWSVLEAISGVRYNALEDAFTFNPAGEDEEFRAPLITRDGWGVIRRARSADGWRVELTCSFGEIHVRQLLLSLDAEQVQASSGEVALASNAQRQGDLLAVYFEHPLVVKAANTLTVAAKH